MDEPLASVIVRCPYCGESVEILVEADVAGEMVQDCEVCCNPWRMRVSRDVSGIDVTVDSLD